MNRIFKVQLRTLDVDAARAFYTSVLGTEPTKVWRLHEQALARGARPHWIGFFNVDDVDRAATLFVERGAVALGPKWVDPDGLEAATMRDPCGAILLLAKPPAHAGGDGGSSSPEVVFHSLNTPDVGRAMVNYTELFGWDFGEPLDLANLGRFHPFRWEAGGPQVGVFSDVAGRPGVHPHWIFHLRVADLDAARAHVLSLGGLALDPVELPNGDRIAVCDDPQGAAFALHEVHGSTSGR